MLKDLQAIERRCTGGEDRAQLPEGLLKELAECRTLPSAPAVVVQLLDLCQDPEAGAADAARVIGRDPALSAKLLKVANSPWCGTRAEVRTLGHAISLLGMNASLSLAMSFSLVRHLRNPRVASFDHHAFWRRSVIAATATRAAGTAAGVAVPDELFVAGLLQDIGILALNEAMPKTYGPLSASAKNDHRELFRIEREQLGADHAQVSEWLLARWNFPESLRLAVGGSHAYQAGGRDQAGRSAAIGSLITEVWTGRDAASALELARSAAQPLLGIPPGRFETLLAEIAAELPKVTDKLEIRIGGRAFVDRLLDQAREVQAELNLQVRHEARRLEIQAQRDHLTSLYNRAYLNEYLRQQFDLSRQTAQPLTVIFLDVDRFKEINDTYGHYAGDQVLISVARVIQSKLREFDTVVRFGGDEFVAVLGNRDANTGTMIAERIRAAVETEPHGAGDERWIRVTVSAGCATMSADTRFRSAKELMEAADRCLYTAKSAGRNCVVNGTRSGVSDDRVEL